jgi:hypothetical protein
MVKVELCRPVRTEDGVEVVAQLVVREGQIEQLDGALAHLIDLGMPVMGISEGKIVRFNDDPEEWARSLIGTFRAPDLFARVAADDHPVPEVEAEPIRVQTPVYH